MMLLEVTEPREATAVAAPDVALGHGQVVFPLTHVADYRRLNLLPLTYQRHIVVRRDILGDVLVACLPRRELSTSPAASRLRLHVHPPRWRFRSGWLLSRRGGEPLLVNRILKLLPQRKHHPCLSTSILIRSTSRFR